MTAEEYFESESKVKAPYYYDEVIYLMERYGKQQWNEAIEAVCDKFGEKSPIWGIYQGFIILAQSPHDFLSKCDCIKYGDTNGFYTLMDIEKLKKK